jgi:hypothetical protein
MQIRDGIAKEKGMQSSAGRTALRHSVLLLAALLLCNACARSYDETIAGVTVPVPKDMKRSGEKPAEMTLLGFGAGHATFQGNMDTEKIVEFYNKELPARGWQSSMNLRSGGAMLAYSKEGKTLLIGIGRQRDMTELTLTVGGVSR